MNASPEQRRTALVLAAALMLSIVCHLVFLTALHNYHEPRVADRQEIQQVTLTTVVHLHTPTPPPPVPTPPPSPTPPPPPTPQPTQTPRPVTPPPATPAPQTPPPATPKPIVHPQAAPKAAHLHLNVPKTTTQRAHAMTEAHADTAPGTQTGTLGGHGTTGGPVGPGPGGNDTGAIPAATAEPVANCPVPNRVPAPVDKFTPEQPEAADGVAGTAHVNVSLDARGNVIDVSIGQSTGNAVLDAAALDAAKRTTYRAERRNCADVPGTYSYRVDFAGGG